jgi:hypothetical protein
MRIALTVTSILFIAIGFSNAQNPPGRIRIIDDRKVHHTVDSLCSRMNEVEIAKLECSHFQLCKGNTIELTFSVCDPEAEELEKELTRKSIETEVNKLIESSTCGTTKNLLLFVIEGIFLTKKEMDKKNSANINLKRFIKLYGKSLTKAYVGKTIYLVDWNW